MTWLHENRLALLRRTRALLAQGWTQKTWARNQDLTGAMRKVFDEAKPGQGQDWCTPLDYLVALLSFREP